MFKVFTTTTRKLRVKAQYAWKECRSSIQCCVMNVPARFTTNSCVGEWRNAKADWPEGD